MTKEERSQQIKKIKVKLESDSGKISSFKAMLGFDGFLDSAVRVVKSRKNIEEYTSFPTIASFGDYICSKAGKSCSIEMVEQVEKIGGNMPIMSLAMAKLGIRPTCIGTFGTPKSNEIFSELQEEGCRMYSIGNPGYTTALEFNDGKVMLAKMQQIQQINWDCIRNRIDLHILQNIFQESHVWALLNWSEMEMASDIWEGIRREILSKCKPDKEKFIFFDLSDCSKREDEDIKYAFSFINDFSRFRKVVLGINENEARVLHRVFFPEICGEPDMEEIGERLFPRSGADVLVIHPVDCAIAWEKGGICKRVEGPYIRHPRISTGGGDNFNAGFAIAQLLKYNLEESMILAAAVAGYFVKYGYSPEMKQLQNFLEDWSLTN